MKHHRPVVLGQHVGRERRRVRIDGQRAQVLDDDEVSAGERRTERAGIGRAPVDGIDGEERQPGVVGAQAVVELACDATDAEAELVQRPFPLARLDRHAVRTTESIRDHDGYGLHWTRRLARRSPPARLRASGGWFPDGRFCD